MTDDSDMQAALDVSKQIITAAGCASLITL